MVPRLGGLTSAGVGEGPGERHNARDLEAAGRIEHDATRRFRAQT